MNLRNYFRLKLSDNQLQELQLNQQQISYIMAGLCVLLFFIFMAGYYWGKKTALEHFTEQLESDSLADKVSYAFCSLYESGEEAEEDDQPEEEPEEAAGVPAGEIPVQTAGAVVAKIVDSSQPANSPVLAQQALGQVAQKQTQEHVAQLAGFGAARTARSYAQILTKKGYDVKIVERKSTTARGKQTCWYQVVTAAYTDKDKLLELIEKIKKVTPIRDVKIVSIDRA